MPNQPLLSNYQFLARRGAALALSLLALSSLCPGVARADRIEQLCDIRGVRPNQLIGYGLIVGLNGTGDRGQARFTVQSTAAMLRRLGATIAPDAIQTKNAAAVMVTATLPAYGSPGSQLDVTVSSLGNARSLEGGTLLQTPLLGADRTVYAVAQGAVIVGGFAASQGGSSVRQNTTTVGRVPAGAIVERRAPTPKLGGAQLTLQLRDPSFITAHRVAEAINDHLQSKAARALDGGTVRVEVPKAMREQPVALVSELQVLEVEPAVPTRVVIDERTGTIVLGAGVRVREAAIAQGGLSVEITRTPRVSQPAPLSRGGTTEVVEEQQIKAEVRPGAIHHMGESASLAEVVAALNALGAAPRNLIAILQGLRSAGALRAEVVVQ
ncbi:MAG: flagellar basal body P-ring protein FlgI [Myxococcales bacterium]|nr:flagellar basal body P-ring protein FlgI [Myxococcales bacterium]